MGDSPSCDVGPSNGGLKLAVVSLNSAVVWFRVSSLQHNLIAVLSFKAASLIFASTDRSLAEGEEKAKSSSDVGSNELPSRVRLLHLQYLNRYCVEMEPNMCRCLNKDEPILR